MTTFKIVDKAPDLPGSLYSESFSPLYSKPIQLNRASEKKMDRVFHEIQSLLH